MNREKDDTATIVMIKSDDGGMDLLLLNSLIIEYEGELVPAVHLDEEHAFIVSEQILTWAEQDDPVEDEDEEG